MRRYEVTVKATVEHELLIDAVDPEHARIVAKERVYQKLGGEFEVVDIGTYGAVEVTDGE